MIFCISAMPDTQNSFTFSALLRCGSPGQTFSMETLLQPEIREYSPCLEIESGEESTIW